MSGLVHEALSGPMTDDEFSGLTVELCELRAKLEGRCLPQGREGA